MTQAKDSSLPELSALAAAAGLDMDEMDGRQRDVHGPDIFARISHFQLADQARAAGLYPFFQPVEVNDGPEAVVEGRRVIMLGSNNYLGLTRHPDVLAAAHAALDRWGPSMTGSRLLNGTSPVHLELEQALAEFLGAEAAIVFSTGYLANLGTVSSLVDRHGVSVLDRAVHASIYDAAAFALGKYVRFQHNDAEHLNRVLSNLGRETPRLVIVDGAYSMGGDLAPLPELREVCARHGTRMLVDDAHAIGTVGPRGRGTHSHFGMDQDEDLIIGTFSKTLASVGGFCAGPRAVIEYVQHFSRPMLFTASLPPPSAAAALAALRLIDEEPWRVQRVQEPRRPGCAASSPSWASTWQPARRRSSRSRSATKSAPPCSGATCSTTASTPTPWSRPPCRAARRSCAPRTSRRTPTSSSTARSRCSLKPADAPASLHN